MSDRRAGWIIVIVSAALAILVCLLAYFVVRQGAVNGAANAGEATIALLGSAAPGILMIVALAVIASFICKDIRVRIAAAAVAVLTMVGVLAAGAIAAETGDPPASAYWAASGNVPGPFDCASLNSDTPAEMLQGALDELDHPEPVEIYIAGEQTCAAMMETTSGRAISSYVSQLEDAGWTILSDDPDFLRASRSGYILWITGCYPDARSAIAIFADRYRYGLSCDDTQP